MKIATRAFVALLSIAFGVSTAHFQTLRPDSDPRNLSPSVGTGGPEGGPTGLFTIYDGQTIRKGEFTFSIAYSNYDRDPGDVDITEVPISFNIGLNDHLELFFKTTGYRGVKVNSPANLSGFYLPNSQLLGPNGPFTPAAIVLAPNGPNVGTLAGTTLFRPAGAPLVGYPFTGGNAGTYNMCTGPSNCPPGTTAGFPGFNAQFGTPTPGGGNFGHASNFPGVGSAYGGILPGVVLATVALPCTALTGNCRPPGSPGSLNPVIIPVTFTIAPSYLPDAPFINRLYGESMWNDLVVGAKWRWTGPKNPIGIGIIPFWRWYMDSPTRGGGFNMLQRGASPGGSIGDIGLIGFADARLSRRVNVSANVGYIRNSNPKDGDAVLLDRPDEVLTGIGFDFPMNKWWQPIAEVKSVWYVGGHTPNAMPQNPVDAIGGIKFYPRRWWGIGAWYRINLNQQDQGRFNKVDGNTSVSQVSGVFVPGRGIIIVPGTTVSATTNGFPTGFRFSNDPHGFGFQVFAGHRNARPGPVYNKPPNVDSVTLSDTVINLPCAAGTRSASGCSDNHSVSVSTKASDPENDVLTYNYTVSGGRVVGSGANVTWDLSGVGPGTYTVTTAVDDGCGVCGKTNTQSITVRNCPDCTPICSCPTLSINGPSGVTTAGQSMNFTATSSGDVTYNWSVSAGTISSGQGTSSVMVDTTGLAPGSSVTATVEIGNANMCAECPKVQSATAELARKIEPELVDTYGKLKDDDVKARIDGYYTQLNNDPSSHGYIIIYGTPAQIKAARAQIMKAITFRKYDPSRLTIVEGPPQGADVVIKLWRVPAGADNPTP